MTREGTILYSNELLQFKKQIEEDTGFVCYEVQPGDQTVFYGTSDKVEALKTLLADKFNTGTIIFTMDDCVKQMYSKYKNAWYDID